MPAPTSARVRGAACNATLGASLTGPPPLESAVEKIGHLRQAARQPESADAGTGIQSICDEPTVPADRPHIRNYRRRDGLLNAP